MLVPRRPQIGGLLNRNTATTWRNAASREEDAIYDELVALARKAI